MANNTGQYYSYKHNDATVNVIAEVQDRLPVTILQSVCKFIGQNSVEVSESGLYDRLGGCTRHA